MQTGWGGDVTPRGLSPSGRPFDKIRNLCWPCNVKGGGSPRAPVAQGAGLSPASEPTTIQPPDGAPGPEGIRLDPHRSRGSDQLGAQLDVTGVQNGRVLPRPPCEYWGSLAAQPGALGFVTVCPLTHQPTRCPPAPYQWEVGVSSPSRWPETRRGAIGFLRACPGGLRVAGWPHGGAVIGGA